MATTPLHMYRNRPIARRGVAALLAMLYLVLFSTLAIGFYAATTSAVQVVGNERRAALAQMAAESGMDFVRYQLAHVTIPHGTPPASLFTTVYTCLQAQINNTGNVTSISRNPTMIYVPGGTSNWVSIDSSGASFQATIENLGATLRVKVVGRHNDTSVTRAVQMNYGLAEKASNIFDFGVASKGKITTGGSSIITGATDPTKGSILSTCMTDPTPVVVGGREVSGDVSICNPAGNVSYSGAKIGGTTDPVIIARDHIHKGVTAPDFPTVDTDIFLPYVTSVYAGGRNLTNCRIRANTNPTFTGGANIQGVVYVETPNRITFRGNSTIQGVIVVQNNPTGDLSTNTISFAGNVQASPVSTLPASFGSLRNLTGSFLLAPNFSVSFTGNFGTVGGSILASQISMTGNATGTVTGSVVNLDNTLMTVNGSADIIIASTGTTNYPAGVYFSSNYAPLPDTYSEVLP